MSIALRPVARLMTRGLYGLMNNRKAWCKQLQITAKTSMELQFWLTELASSNGQNIWHGPAAVLQLIIEEKLLLISFPFKFIAMITPYLFDHTLCRLVLVGYHTLLKLWAKPLLHFHLIILLGFLSPSTDASNCKSY